MLAYAFMIAFVGAFIALAATGHVLLLMAFYPDLFGLASLDAEPPHAEPADGVQRTPKLAA
ncbi:MAG TPA: hypothetical protein VD863_16860 [Bradyrhizobium sp.]|nr:hypothetical protein [Bradyrhizobium sp.]